MAYVIDREHCSCCHCCKTQCPVEAIRFLGSKYWIDPDKCIDCGHCAEVCHNCVISKAGEDAPAPVPHDLKTLYCDLLVVGAGGSGLIAANKAASATGKKVIVVEKSKKPGGNTWYAGGFRTYYSKLHAQAGAEDERDKMLRQFMQDVLWRCDHHLVKNLLQANGDLFDWMYDECGAQSDFKIGKNPFGGVGVEFTYKSKLNPNRIDTSIGPGSIGSYVIELMLKKANELGVEILTEHAAAKLLVNEEGKLYGVLCNDPGGQTEIRCQACVLATGAFSWNDELIKKVRPEFLTPAEPVHRFSVPTCTGDGLLMAEEAGALIDYENTRVAMLGPAHHPFGFATVCICREPEVALFDVEGRRWANETENTMNLRHVFQKYPGGICYAVADSNICKITTDHLIENGRDGETGVKIFKNYLNELEEESGLDTPTKKADTLEELAAMMGVDPEVFVTEVNRYNEFCRKGYDDDFFKEAKYLIPIEQPPFYAFSEKWFHENAIGGMVIDSETKVMSKNGPIPGLFGAGDNTRGIMVAGDVGFDAIERTISALTFAVSSGYLAGCSAASYIK